jgi:hypothetical protein
VGAPKGNKNAMKHGFYCKPPRPLETIDDALAHMAECLTQLADYLRDNQDALSVDELVRLSTVRGQNLGRFTRMLRDKNELEGGHDADLQGRIQEALHRASAEIGVDL